MPDEPLASSPAHADDALPAEELAARRRLLELNDDDLRCLREVAAAIGERLPELVHRTYTQDLMQYGPPAKQLSRVAGEGRLDKVAAKLVDAFREQLEAPIDDNYTRRRAEIGRVHARIGLEPKWYYGALNLMQQRIAEALAAHPSYAADPTRIWVALRAISKVHAFDAMIVLDAYTESTVGRAMRNVSTAVAQSPIGVFITDTRGVIEYVNPHIEQMTGFAKEELIGKTPKSWRSGLTSKETYEALWHTIMSGKVFNSELRNKRKGGELYWVRARIAPLVNLHGDLVGFVGIHEDISAQKGLETQLRQSERLASVGTLAAGVAHEINTPVQFVSDSIHFIGESVGEVFSLLERLRAVRRLAAGEDEHGSLPDALAAAADAEERADLGYLLDQVPKALERCADGLQRVSSIVRSLKEFAHPPQRDMAPADLNRAIDNTLTIASAEYKYVADLEKELGELPAVTCFASELNQVFLNLVVNAAHAIGEVVGKSGARGKIKVSTRVDGDHIEIVVADTGSGIPEHVAPHVFEPFYTTKALGKGTGQGLALAWSVVTQKHGGTLRFDTKVGAGTTFFVRIPIAGVRGKAQPAADPLEPGGAIASPAGERSIR
ncbi:MAG: PAS domain S-box protein [Deltaproteobacteria bacterium]|nr:PAS domain S-box protein [Deltaproteobacteria bacterium]